MRRDGRTLESVTAGKSAARACCPESWRLAALGHESANQPAQTAGTLHHTELASVERVECGSIALGRILIAVALLALLAAIL